MEEKITAGNPPCQLISFVMDNSASCKKEALAALMGGFRRLAEQTRGQAAVEWELSCFDTFTPCVVKHFDGEEVAPVRACRMPLLSRALFTAKERLGARAAALREEGRVLYRPWMFILSSGFTLDDVEEVVNALDEMEHNGELLYLPFKLGPKLYTERIRTLDRVKQMIEIKSEGVEGFFDFVGSMLERRLTSPEDAGIKFRKTDFEGWAVL